MSSEDAFFEDIKRTLTLGEDTTADDVLNLARSVCEGIDTAVATDGSLAAELAAGVIVTALTNNPGDGTPVVLRAGGEHLCPHHASTIDTELANLGQ